MLYERSVLLIDDDAADLKLLARELRNIGLPVIETQEPDRAIAEAASGRIGCIIADQAMPMLGSDLLRAVADLRSDICMILISGVEFRPPSLVRNARFVPKGSTVALKSAVLECMSHHRKPQKDRASSA